MALIDADALNLTPELIESLFQPLNELNSGGKRKYLMTVAHSQEDDLEKPFGNYDLSFSGQRAFAVEAFDPWFKHDKHWTVLMSHMWPEPGLRYLIAEDKTKYLPELVFRHRAANRHDEVNPDPKSREYWVEQEWTWKLVEKYARKNGLKPKPNYKLLDDDIRPKEKPNKIY